MASRLARCAFSAAIILAAGLCALPASADAGERIVPPPLAFVEFCYREPKECPSVPASAATAMGDRSREASANYWRLVFSTGGPDAISLDRAAVPALVPEQRRAALADVAKVNLAINRKLSERSDQSVYARQDYWALPLAHGAAVGDCEDFVLEKRRMLRGMGYTERQMSIAIVKTPWGQNHAVLLVTADGGEVVLDNLSPHVQPWGSSSYTLLTRQSSDDPSMWIVPR